MRQLPLERDPGDILEKIAKESSWSPDELRFLKALSEDDFYQMLKGANGERLHAIIRTVSTFGNMSGANVSDYRVIHSQAISAMKKIAGESVVNEMRLRPYIPKTED